MTKTTDYRVEDLLGCLKRNIADPKSDLASRSRTPQDVGKAVATLIKIGGEAAPRVLEELKVAEYAPLKGHLVKIIGEIGDEKAIPVLDGLSGHRNRRLRLDAKGALERIMARMGGELLDARSDYPKRVPPGGPIPGRRRRIR